jgi:hypothetical protein
MTKWIIAGWMTIGIASVAVVISIYRAIIKIEDGSDWFYE